MAVEVATTRLNGATGQPIVQKHDTAEDFEVENGHLTVLTWVNGRETQVAVYAPGAWSHAVVMEPEK